MVSDSQTLPSSSYKPEPKAEITKLAFRVVNCSSSSIQRPSSLCSVRLNVTETIFPSFKFTLCGERNPTNSQFSSTAKETCENNQ